MARIALAAGLAVAGAVLGVMTGGLGAFALGAWGQDIVWGATLGFGAGDAKSGLFLNQTFKREGDADEIETPRN